MNIHVLFSISECFHDALCKRCVCVCVCVCEWEGVFVYCLDAHTVSAALDTTTHVHMKH